MELGSLSNGSFGFNIGNIENIPQLNDLNTDYANHKQAQDM